MTFYLMGVAGGTNLAQQLEKPESLEDILYIF
jgi:hypothetical protein